LRAQVLAQGEGTEKMREIAAAVQEGAAAYLHRQFRTLSWFVGIVFFLLLASALPTPCHCASAAQSSSFSAQVSLPSLDITVCGLQCAQMFALQKLLARRMEH
jgi:Na+/H+-translocating membrane pyrophosphatase